MYEETSQSVSQPFRGRVFSVEVHDVLLPDGRPAKREVVRHGGGACVLAVGHDGTATLVRQYRKPFDTVMLEIPAGKLEAGEDPLDCARRELSEETGFSARHFRLLSRLNPSPGYCSEIISIYLATGLTAGSPHLDEGEFLHCETRQLAEWLALVDQGEISDAKTVTALLMADRLITRNPGVLQEAEG